MNVAGAMTAWLVPLILLAGIIGVEWKRKYPDVHIADYVRADFFTVGILALCALIWLIPLGWLLAFPASIIALGIRSIASEDARVMWVSRWKARGLLVIAVAIGVFLSGFGAVSEPIGANEWGEPLLTENPDAPAWPASEQYTWVNYSSADEFPWVPKPSDITIIVANNVRLPGTLSPYGSASCALWWLEFSDTDDERLKLAVETMLAQTNGVFPESYAEHFSLQTVSSGEAHEYDSETLPYSHKYVTVDLFGETKIAEVITVAKGTWGGEVQLLTMIKPMLGQTSPFYADNDEMGASFVEDWLDANA